MIPLFHQNILTPDRQSSKGNQLKWCDGEFWYKADYTGYEGLSETVVSCLLAKSSLSAEAYVSYEPVEISYKDQIFRGCRSVNFLHGDWQLYTIERLYHLFKGQSLYQSLSRITDPPKRLQFLVSEVIRMTGLTDFGIYMNRLLTIDALFLNEDRHLHNIAVLVDRKGNFDYCPIFDHGAALLSDTSMNYPLTSDPYELISSVKARTFCSDFTEQLSISEELFGSHLHFSFSRKDVLELLADDSIYSKEERYRVETVLLEQMRRYPYLFQAPEDAAGKCE